MIDVDTWKQYYKFIFPATQMYRWLSYEHRNQVDEDGKCQYFNKREFSFTLEGDIYC